jgi:hypothetical protein
LQLVKKQTKKPPKKWHTIIWLKKEKKGEVLDEKKHISLTPSTSSPSKRNPQKPWSPMTMSLDTLIKLLQKTNRNQIPKEYQGKKIAIENHLNDDKEWIAHLSQNLKHFADEGSKDKIACIIELFRERERMYVSLCIDTFLHAVASGNLNIVMFLYENHITKINGATYNLKQILYDAILTAHRTNQISVIKYIIRNSNMIIGSHEIKSLCESVKSSPNAYLSSTQNSYERDLKDDITPETRRQKSWERSMERIRRRLGKHSRDIENPYDANIKICIMPNQRT